MKEIVRHIKIILICVCVFPFIDIKADDIVKVIMYPDSMEFSAEELVLLRDGIFALEGTHLVALEKIHVKYDLSKKLTDNIDDIITTKFGEVVKTGNKLYLLNDTLTMLMSFNKDKFRIYPYQGDIFFISYSEGKHSYLCGVNIVTNKLGEILKLDEDIIAVTHIENKLFITTKACIYMFNDNGTCTRLLSAWEPFQSAVMTSSGMLIGTDNSISLVTDEETFVPLIKTGCKKMYYSEGYLYIYTPDNALLKINFNELGKKSDLQGGARYLSPSKVIIELK